MAMESALLVTAVCCHVGSMVVLLVCFATPAWIVGGSVTHKVAIGLWDACLNGQCASVFDDQSRLIDTMGGWFRVVQGLLTASVVAFNLAFLLVIVSVCRRSLVPGSLKESTFWTSSVPAKILELAVLLLVSGLLCFSIQAHTNHIHGGIFFYGASFYGCMVSCMVGATACILYELGHGTTHQSRLGYIVLKN